MSHYELLEQIKLNYPTAQDLNYYAIKLFTTEEKIKELVTKLIKQRYPIKLIEGTVKLTVPMISPSKIKAQLDAQSLDYSLAFYPSIESTNEEALSKLTTFSHQTVFLTDYQYKGKGRLGRKWESPIGSAVTLSILLKPDFTGERAVLFTQLAAAAVVKTLDPYVSAKIKWPNDIIVNNKKVAGILTETSFNGSELEGVVIGIGINTSLASEEINPVISDKATSLLIETKQHIDPNELISSFLTIFNRLYQNWQLTDDSSEFITLCKKASLLIGKEIIVWSNETARLAYVRDINSFGELLVQYNDETHPTPLRTLDFSIRGLNSYI